MDFSSFKILENYEIAGGDFSGGINVDFYDAYPVYLVGNIIHFKEFWPDSVPMAALLITTDVLLGTTACLPSQLLAEAVLAQLLYTHWVSPAAPNVQCRAGPT